MKEWHETVFVFITCCAGIAFLILLKVPNPYQYELEDWLKRLGTPVFIEPPDNFSARDQNDLIREYQNRGHELQCYGNHAT